MPLKWLSLLFGQSKGLMADLIQVSVIGSSLAVTHPR
jgi:hypothetical protein